MARRGYDPDNPEAYEAQRNLLDMYGNYISGPRSDRSTPYDLGLWGSAGVPLFEQMHGDEGGVNYTENSPLTFNKNGQEMFRLGQRGAEIPDVWKGTEFEKQIQFDPTYGYYMPKDSFFQAQELFPKDQGWLGPLAIMSAMFALPMMAQMGAAGAAGAGSAAEAGASAGGAGAAVGGSGGSLLEGGLAGLSDFSLAAPGTGIGGVGTAGLGLSATPGALLTPEMIAAGGGLGAFSGLPAVGAGTGAGLGLGLTAGSPIMNTAASLASQAGVGSLAAPTGAAAGSGIGSGLGASPATGGAGTSIWSTISKALGLPGSGGAASGAASGLSPLMQLLGGGLEWWQSGQNADKLSEAIKAASEKADPFASQRGFYQDMLKQSYSDPNFFANNPVFAGMRDIATNDAARKMSAGGYTGSGNILHEIADRVQKQGMNYATQFQGQLAQNAGAGISPGVGANIAAQGANQVMQANQQQNGAMGNTLANLPGAIGQLGNVLGSLI